MEKSIRLMDGQIYRGKNNSIFHYCEGKLTEHKPSSLRTCFCIGCFSKLYMYIFGCRKQAHDGRKQNSSLQSVLFIFCDVENRVEKMLLGNSTMKLPVNVLPY